MSDRERLEALRQRKRLNELRALKAQQPQQEVVNKTKGVSFGDQVMGGLEAAATIGSSIIAEPIAGLTGIGAALNPFNEKGAGARAVESTRKALIFEPTLPGAKAALSRTAEAIQPAAEFLQQREKNLGDFALEATGSPTAAAIATTLPTALGELLGVAGIRSGTRAASKIDSIKNAIPDERVSSILSAAKQSDVPVMTTDLFPPESFVGRTAQSLSEKLGPLGSGTARASQQRARIEAVSSFADNIDIDTPFADSLVKSLNKKTAKTLERAGIIRDEAINKIDEFGDFPNNKAIKEIDNLLEKQNRLGATANKQLTDELNSFKAELSTPTDFSLTKDLRTQLIKKVKAFSRAEDIAPAADLQKVKSALDKDMIAFARTKDKTATRKWLAANRKFAEELGVAKETEIKRILQSGEATPEKVIPILKGGKTSELNRLHNALGEKGRAAARGSLIQQALKDSKFFEVDANPNPDALATALNRPSFQQASKVFFKGKDKAELDGFIRLLNATRRAQSGQAVVKTGEALLLPGGAAGLGAGVGTGVVSAPLAAGLLGTGAAIAKTYESKAFRNLLIRLNRTQVGSTQETKALESAVPFALSGLQAAKTELEEKQ
ncbi:MAG: hypothetical protein GY787_16170 [Alteromonadales bacterium]|nr:hypothetical protein [Alteromonadales bacterium]